MSKMGIIATIVTADWMASGPAVVVRTDCSNGRVSSSMCWVRMSLRTTWMVYLYGLVRKKTAGMKRFQLVMK